MKKTEVFWKIIEKNKIEYVFGMAGSPVVPLLSYKPTDVKWINVGNELDNGFVAQSYGLFSQTVGVIIVTGGPGIATAISALGNAVHEKMPLVVVSVFGKNKGGFQSWDIINISNEITPYTVTIKSNEDFEKKVNYAFYIAKTLNTGVTLLIEENTMLDTISYHNSNFNFRKLLDFDNENNIVKKVNKDLNNTDLLVVLGYIPNIDYNVIKTFLTNNNIPFVLTWKERTILTDKYYCGLIGSLGYHSANYAVYHAKNLLIFGNISSKLNNSSYNEAFSIDYKINKSIYSIVADEPDAIEQSTEIFTTDNFEYIFKNLRLNTPKEFLDRLSETYSILRHPLKPKSYLEKYCYLSSIIYNKQNLNIPVVTGVGNHWYSVGKYFTLTKSNSWLSSTEWATIGCGFFYGIGAYLALKKPVWVFEGDGGTIFAGSTLLYLINNKHLPITIILFKDKQYSAIVESFDKQNLSENHKKNKEIICKTENIDEKIFPNCYNFYEFKEFYEYLSKYPISKKLRFIIVHIPKGHNINNSGVFSTNIHDKKYISLLKNNEIESINNYETVYKEDKHN